MKRIVLAGVLVATSMFAGCGDSEDALSEEEFLKQGNVICAAGNEKLDAALEKAFGDLEGDEQPGTKELKSFLDGDFVPTIQTQIDSLRVLKPPEELSDDVEAMLDDAQEALDGMKEQAKDDPAAIFEAEEDPFADVNAEAGKLGLEECAG